MYATSLALALLCAAPSSDGGTSFEPLPVGYQKARWGMSQKEVAKLFPKVRPINNQAMTFKGNTAGYQSQTTFFFVNNKLSQVTVDIESKSSQDNDFDSFAELLQKKYGDYEPLEARSGRRYLWEDNNTRLYLEHNPINTHHLLAITYLSLELHHEFEHLDKSAADDL